MKEIKTMHQSLIEFRSKIDSVQKSATNPHFKSKYADLHSILEAIKEPLKECGLSVSHRCEYMNDSLVVITDLENGEDTITSVFPVHGQKPQEIGSSMTYARRYNLSCLLDLPTADDDGNSANDSKKITQKQIVWFDPKNEKHTTAVKVLHDSGTTGADIIKKIKEKGLAISKANQTKIINNEF